MTEWLRSSPGTRVRRNSPGGSNPLPSASSDRCIRNGLFYYRQWIRTRKGLRLRWSLKVRARLWRAQDGRQLRWLRNPLPSASSDRCIRNGLFYYRQWIRTRKGLRLRWSLKVRARLWRAQDGRQLRWLRSPVPSASLTVASATVFFVTQTHINNLIR